MSQKVEEEPESIKLSNKHHLETAALLDHKTGVDEKTVNILGRACKKVSMIHTTNKA